MDKSNLTRKEFLSKLGVGTFAMAASGLLLPKSVMGGVRDNLNDGELVKQVNTNTKNISALNNNLAAMKTNFQAGVDSVFDAIVAKGTTPASKSLSDVVTAIGEMSCGVQTYTLKPANGEIQTYTFSGTLESVSVTRIESDSKSYCVYQKWMAELNIAVWGGWTSSNSSSGRVALDGTTSNSQRPLITSITDTTITIRFPSNSNYAGGTHEHTVIIVTS